MRSSRLAPGILKEQKSRTAGHSALDQTEWPGARMRVRLGDISVLRPLHRDSYLDAP